LADKKISELDAVTDVQATDEFVLARGGASKKITGANLESEMGGGSLPAWWTVDSTPGDESVDFGGQVTVTPPDNTGSQLVRIVAPAGYEANAPSNGPMLEMFDTDNSNTLWSMDINGRFVLEQPTAHTGHEAGFYIQNQTPGIFASFRIDGDGGTLVLSNAAGSPSHRMTGDKLGFYGAIPTAQQTGVAVSAPAIHAALVNLGLITA
jgi:hypothetical protein